MTRANPLRPVEGRIQLFLIGALFVLFGVGYPFVPGIDQPLSVDVLMVILVVGPGVILLGGVYRLPQSDVDPELYPVVAKWSLGGIATMIGLVGLVALSGELTNPVQNLLILPALGSVAGLAAGTHDARAKTRTRVLERRNRELREAQDELEESEHRYRTLAENFPNGAVALLDEELRQTLVAGQALADGGFDPGDLQGERIHDAYPDDFVATIEPYYRATLEGEPTTFEAEMGGRTYEFRTHPLTTDGSGTAAILAMTQDVTVRKLRERELTRRADQQQAVADLGQLALETDDLDQLMADAVDKVVDALDVEYCNVLDLDSQREELHIRQGVGWKDGLVGGTTVSAVGDASQAAVTLTQDQPIVVEDYETESRIEGPHELTDHGVRSGISTIIGPFDEPWGILGVHDTEPQTFTDEDVSFVQSVANIVAESIERQQYQRELEALVADLEESNRRLEQFAYAASHDLQEPLRMVSSYLQLIEQRYADEFDEEGLEFLEFAVDGADRMRSMIDGLLLYSRVETAANPFEPVDLDAVLEDVRENLQVTIEDTNATITADGLPRVEGDLDQLRQVFQNLLDNAIEYSGDEPPTIHVTARRDGSEWIVTVEDEGVGIDPADQDRVFEVFERVHSRDGANGTGIGLALVQRIVERHGGDIWVDAEPGEGTAFSFSLPAASNTGI